DAVKQQRQQEGLSFLQSGVSPEDVTYRRIQQSLANLGAFVNNETPEAQFGQLSGAQSGAAPFTSTGTPAAGLNPNAGAEGISNAFLMYHNQLAQGNSVLGGISTGVNTLATANNLGWNPWSPATISRTQNNAIANEFNGVGAWGTTGSNSPINAEGAP
ncbi:MAG TPA: hypothetical protein VNM37_04055, partial [Candidatus Dormibacteraeota bacterium]|nr:hypothetical protein [Candidatus Dormibacteraeota bacterium]